MANMTGKAALLMFGAAVAFSGPAFGQGRFVYNPSLNSVNQPVVQRTDYVIDLVISGNGLTDRELGRLAGWFEGLTLGYGDRISVEFGGYEYPEAREDIARVAGDYGLLLSHGAPVTEGTVQPGAVRVVVSRSVAFVPGCPDWDDVHETGNRISTASNYGCATNGNLAVMIADPNDLVLGQAGVSGGDAATTSKAIDAYRKRPPSGAAGQVKSESTGGK